MKKVCNVITLIVLVTILVLSAMTVMPIKAETETDSAPIAMTTDNTCGVSSYYEFFEDEGRLFILGVGAVTSAPWSEFASSIKYIVVSQEITSLPKGCFAACNNLIELTVPFIGASRSATNKNAILGYFFEETDYYYIDVMAHGTQGQYEYFWYGSVSLYNNDVCITSYRTNTNDYYDRFGTSGSFVGSYRVDIAKFAALRYISDVWGFPTSTENNSFVNHKLGNQSGHYYSCYNGERVTYYSTTYYSPTTTYYNIPKSLSTINLTDSTTLSAGALNNCSNIKEVNFLKTKTSFGDYALLNCSAIVCEKEYAVIGDIAYSYRINNNNEAEIVYISTTLETLSIPKKIGEYKVSTICDLALVGNSAIRQLHIPETITYIGKYAFYNCVNIEEINIPESCTCIDDYAFCNSLSAVSINIPNNVKTVGKYCFANCTSLQNIVVPESKISFSTGVFSNCTSLKSVVIGSLISEIPDYAFYNCKSLSSVVVGYSVTSIGDYAFYACTGLDTLYIYAPVSSFGLVPFYGADNVTVHIGNDQYMIDYFDNNAINYIIMDNYEYQYEVIFKNENGDIISSNLYNRGEMPSIPETPAKAPNLIYQYVFSGWDSKVTAVSKNIVYTAVFEEVFIEYTIIFKNEDGTILSEETYHYSDIVVAPSKPKKPSDENNCYVFAGWDKSVTVCCGDTEYTAVYEYNQHAYDNACDATCNTCNYVRNITHAYDNACDTICNCCGHTRNITHSYKSGWTKDSSQHWYECSVCGAKKETADHIFDNACDTACNVCDYVRTITHSYKTIWDKDSLQHWHECAVCEDKKNIDNHTYDNSCDTTCNVCGYIRTITHSYKTIWDKDSSQHWHECSVCGDRKDMDGHQFDNERDEICNTCGYVRIVYVVGDVDGSEKVNKDDAIYLLMATFFPEDYPLNQGCDFDGNSKVDKDDAIYLLMYTFFPDDYPLTNEANTVYALVPTRKKDEE